MKATIGGESQSVGTESKPAFGVLSAISLAHVFNDMMQSLILAIYPILQGDFNLSFMQIGLITLTYQMTASILQPFVGMFTDRHPLPYSLPVGMCFTLTGLVLLSLAPTYASLLVAASLVGMGSSIFHPESSRVARMASGGRYSFAQSVFQVGGNIGSALGPLLAAWVVLGRGRGSVAWFALAALLGIVVLIQVGGWYRRYVADAKTRKRKVTVPPLASRGAVWGAISLLMLLMFSKFFYMASISSYFELYLIDHFGVSIHTSQIFLFLFLGSVALGTIVGGPLGDKIGRKTVIWFSILGVAPFTLALPYVGLGMTAVLSVIIGLILASAFPSILVYAQDLVPHRIGAISGMFYGLSFGLGGIGAAVLGLLADHSSIEMVYRLCAFLPLLGLVAAFLPNIRVHTD